MKNFILISLLFSLLGYSKSTCSQNTEKADSIGLPGDNLNLYVVLQLFQESKTLEEFEKKLNQESLNVNNLDLNNDDKIDYIKVIDNKSNGAHAIVLQTHVSDKETQDIAVIEVEKDKSDKVVVQVVGNEELYGKDYIIEPKENDSSSKLANDNAYKKAPETVESPKVYVSINYWPVIQYMYAPDYVVYVSPWYWSYYPVWWNPWTPWYWHRYYYHHYHHHHHHYYGYYHRTYVYRNQGAHTYYGPRRSTSTYVQRNRTEGRYNSTYKREPIGIDKNRPSRPNPGYQKPANQPTRDKNQVNPQNPRVNPNPRVRPSTKPETRPQTRPAPRPTQRPETRPKSNPSVNPRINRPTQQPRQNRPTRQPAQNKGSGNRR